MSAICGKCFQYSSWTRVRRIGDRSVCDRCVAAADRRRSGRGPGPIVRSVLSLPDEDDEWELDALERRDVRIACVVLPFKTLLFAALAVWAYRSDAGYALLAALVPTELVTWLVLRFLDAPFRKRTLGFELVFEAAIGAVLLHRSGLLGHAPPYEQVALVFLASFGYASGKFLLWIVLTFVFPPDP